MEDEIVRFVNIQKKDIRDRLIEYLKCHDYADIEEHSDKIKKMKKADFIKADSHLKGLLINLVPIKEVLKKLEVDSQSHST